MERTNLTQKTFLVLLTAAFVAFGCLLVSTARRTSLVYDEVIYAPMGLIYWKQGDFRWNPIHPPLQKLMSALPLLSQDVLIPDDIDPRKNDEWRTGFRIFFQSPTSAQKLIFLSRLPTIAISFLLAFLIFWMAFRFTGSLPASVLSGLVFMFDPLVLGNGALAINDTFVALFSFAAVIAFDHGRKVPEAKRSRWAALTGAAAGAAIASKLSGLLLGPIFLVLYLRQRPLSKIAKRHLIPFFILSGAALLIVLACYRFDTISLLNAAVQEMEVHKPKGSTGFLLGPVSGRAGWFYYPIAVLIKTPLPLLFLWVSSVWVLFHHTRNIGMRFLILTPVCVFWLAVILSRNHFGIRYLLPTLPFLALAIGCSYIHLKSKWESRAYWLMAGWLIAEALIVHPHHMAYFNQIVDGPSKGHRWLDGSNQDWGQDLPTLAAALENQNPKPAVCFGYWGSNRPEAWGIEYQDVYSPAIANSFREDRANPIDVPREWLVVSANLRANHSIRDAYRWLEDKKPIAFLGHTLFVYDISSDIESVLNIANIYYLMGRWDLAKRQIERAIFLNPLNIQLKKELLRYEKMTKLKKG